MSGLLLGKVFDVVVDLRKYSPTFGQWSGIRLTAQSPMVLVLRFAHGFYVVSDWANLFTKTTDYYAPEWEEPFCGTIPRWQLTGTSRMGFPRYYPQKDAAGSAFHEADVYQEILEQP